MIQELDGWFYSEKFGHYQKVKNEVYVYISRTIFGLQAQLYMRGETGLCELEVRTETQDKRSLLILIEIAEKWLEDYSDGDKSRIHKDRYSISNPDGVWGTKQQHKKLYWIK